MTIAKIAIIGAGPYGLSIAAHLGARGMKPLVFGSPMQSWREGMPRGMRLKSDGFASSLSDPEGRMTLKAFCESEKLPYADINLPVPVDTFLAYGDAFQKRLVPQVDTRKITQLRRAGTGFTLRLDDGAEIDARKVIVATGIHPFRHIPEALRGLSGECLSHSSELADYASFAGRKVAVIGSGASATDIAAALLGIGAEVTLICRRPTLRFYPGGAPRHWLDPLVAPQTPLGPGWKKLLCVKAPLLFRLMPESFRTMVVKRFLGPSPCWFIRDEIDGKMSVIGGATITGARETGAGVRLDFRRAGAPASIEADHIVSATGFRIDVARLAFLPPEIVSALALTETAPKLSASFESSVPGLHFAGTMAAFEFGPLLRFVCGADFTARRIARHLAGAAARTASGDVEDYRALPASAGHRPPSP